MKETSQPISDERPLTSAERELARSMLTEAGTQATSFLSQLEGARVVSRCPCGCASVDFQVAGLPEPSGGIRILGDFVFGGEHDLSGIFIFERGGVLAGIEVYGLAGDAPRELPSIDSLRPFDSKRSS